MFLVADSEKKICFQNASLNFMKKQLWAWLLFDIESDGFKKLKQEEQHFIRKTAWFPLRCRKAWHPPGWHAATVA